MNGRRVSQRFCLLATLCVRERGGDVSYLPTTTLFLADRERIKGVGWKETRNRSISSTTRISVAYILSLLYSNRVFLEGPAKCYFDEACKTVRCRIIHVVSLSYDDVGTRHYSGGQSSVSYWHVNPGFSGRGIGKSL